MTNPFERLEPSAHTQEDPHQAENTAQSFLQNMGRSFAYTLVQSPLDGVVQLASHARQAAGAENLQPLHIVDAPASRKAYTSDWVAQQVGSGVAMLGDFLAAGYLLSKSGVTASLGETPGLFARSASLSLKTQMGLGAAYAGVFTPVNENGDFVKERITNAVVGALSFAAMERTGAAFKLLGESSVPVFSTVARNQGARALFSGATVGSLDADIDSEVRHGHLATGSQRLQSALSFAIISGAMAGGQRLRYSMDNSSSALAGVTENRAATETSQEAPALVAEPISRLQALGRIMVPWPGQARYSVGTEPELPGRSNQPGTNASKVDSPPLTRLQALGRAMSPMPRWRSAGW